MKSDQEFLKGVYEKVKVMEGLEPKERDGYERRKSTLRAMPLKYAVTAAAFLILVTAGAYIFDKNKTAEQVSPKPFTIDVRGIDSKDGLKRLFDNATDIIEIRQEDSSKRAYQVIEIYRHSDSENDILSELFDQLPQLEENQTAIVFMKKEPGSTTVLDSFIGSPGDETYQNTLGETVTKEKILEDIKE
jgi:hypothetical protein